MSNIDIKNLGAESEVGSAQIGRNPELVLEAQKQRATSQKFANDFCREHSLPQSEATSLADLHQKLVLELSKRPNLDIRKATQQLSQEFELLAKDKNPSTIASIVSSLSQIASDKPKISSEFDRLKYAICLDLISELANPLLSIDQGRSNACAVTARRYIAQHPERYAEFLSDVVSNGYGYTGKSESGAKQGYFEYKQGMFSSSDLKGRSLGNAIYQSVMLESLGSPEEGLMPLDVERFMEARGQAGRIYTANNNVSSNPDKMEEVENAILKCAKAGKTGLISLEFADSGAHCKHVLELCPQDGVPRGFVKLSNPWDVNEKLPERYKKMVQDNGDGTFLIRMEDLKANIYFAALETGDSADFGSTEGARQGFYRRDMIASSAENSYFGFSYIEKQRKLQSEAVVTNSDKSGIVRRDDRAGPLDNLTQNARDSQTSDSAQLQESGAKYFQALATRS